ncbi:hypothetical protein HDU91_007509 [Kappamyces sp. JEL0680]|nr:hypothetical protein HDU91_007509 [Kappamyces sp. JEL0680]
MSNKTALPPLPTLLNEDGVGNLSTPASLLPPGRAQCYIAIFEDALEQLSVLGDITPEAMKTDNKQLAEKITKILGEQRMLQDKYQELLLERDQSKGMANKTKFKEIQSTLADISNQLSLLTQTLGRLLKTHPSVAQNLLKIQQERSALQALLARSIRELRECKFDSLIHAVEEEYKKRNTLQNTISRESDAQETLKELQRELANEKKLIQDETNDRNQVIQQLKDTIQEINALTVSEQKYIKKEVKAHENSYLDELFVPSLLFSILHSIQNAYTVRKTSPPTCNLFRMIVATVVLSMGGGIVTNFLLARPQIVFFSPKILPVYCTAAFLFFHFPHLYSAVDSLPPQSRSRYFYLIDALSRGYALPKFLQGLRAMEAPIKCSLPGQFVLGTLSITGGGLCYA